MKFYLSYFSEPYLTSFGLQIVKLERSDSSGSDITVRT